MTNTDFKWKKSNPSTYTDCIHSKKREQIYLFDNASQISLVKYFCAHFYVLRENLRVNGNLRLLKGRWCQVATSDSVCQMTIVFGGTKAIEWSGFGCYMFTKLLGCVHWE